MNIDIQSVERNKIYFFIALELLDTPQGAGEVFHIPMNRNIGNTLVYTDALQTDGNTKGV